MVDINIGSDCCTCDHVRILVGPSGRYQRSIAVVILCIRIGTGLQESRGEIHLRKVVDKECEPWETFNAIAVAFLCFLFHNRRFSWSTLSA